MQRPVTRHSSPFARRLALAAAAMVAAAGAFAATASFPYQGRLLAADGTTPLAGTQTIEFRIYNTIDGSTPVWGRAFNVLLDGTGLFNVEVSDSAGSYLENVPSSKTLHSVFAENVDTTLYIGITVAGTSGEIAPRQALLAVPYATFSADVASASGDFSAAGRVTAASADIANAVTAGSLAVAGQLGAASISSTGNANIGGDLSVGGTLEGFGIAPVGSIILWSGAVSDIPDGWVLCNGQSSNGKTTPDLRGRFVVGYDDRDGDYNAVGKTGGEKKHTLTVSEMPAHSHSYSFKGADLNGSWDSDNYFFDASEHYSGNSRTRSTNSTGSGGAHENRPPYYVLCYIMRVR